MSQANLLSEREALWINFMSTAPFLIKVYAGGVNVVSGEQYQEDIASKLRHLSLQQQQKNIQDYVVVPDQLWLDGIATSPGVVSQFVAVQKGSGYSIEAQTTGRETACGLSFEVTPLNKMSLYNSGELKIFVKTLKSRTLTIMMNSSDTVGTLKTKIQVMDGTPIDQQRLILAGEQLEDGRTLSDYGVRQVSSHLTGKILY